MLRCVEEVLKSMQVLGREEGLESEVCVAGICLDHVWEFKYLGCVLDESGTDEAECSLTVLGSCMSHCSFLFLCMVD